MVSKFNATIFFCGQERKFKRCPMKALKNYQKSIEDYQNKLYPLAESNRDFQFEMDEILGELDIIDNHLILLEKLKDPTDEEIRESINLNSKKSTLKKKAHKLRVKKDKKDLNDKETYSKLDDELKQNYDDFSTLIFENFESGEFLENFDTGDLDVAPHLAELYRLALVGATQEEMDEAYRNLITDSFQ